MCQDCDVWVHIKCCGVDPGLYDSYMNGVGLSDWQCPLCLPVRPSDNDDTDHSNINVDQSSDSEADKHSLQGLSKKPKDLVRIAVINVNSLVSS